MVNDMEIALREINALMNRTLGRTRSASYRYVTDDKGNRFIYTTARVLHNGKQKFVSGMYRYNHSKKQYKLCHVAGHGKKFRARERAYALCDKWKKNHEKQREKKENITQQVAV